MAAHCPLGRLTWGAKAARPAMVLPWRSQFGQVCDQPVGLGMAFLRMPERMIRCGLITPTTNPARLRASTSRWALGPIAFCATGWIHKSHTASGKSESTGFQTEATPGGLTGHYFRIQYYVNHSNFTGNSGSFPDFVYKNANDLIVSQIAGCRLTWTRGGKIVA